MSIPTNYTKESKGPTNNRLTVNKMDIPSELATFLNQEIPFSRQIDIGFELFEFPSVDQLVDFQIGYRWHGLTQERAVDWNGAWIVFGSSNADPLIFDSVNGEVLFARHGAGSWSPVVLFSDLDEMTKCFHRISDVVQAADQNLHDNDLNIRPEYVHDIKQAVIDSVGQEQAERIIEALEIKEF